MRLSLADTIVAIASAAGGSLAGIIRVSGTDALRWAAECCPAEKDAILAASHPQAIEAHFQRTSFEPRPLRALPVTLYLWPGKRSYTREPSVEIHTIGSPPVLSQLVTTLCQKGCRLAEPGEFTLRAFLAGRMDLTQAEAVLGVIDARGEQELKTSLAQLAGGLAHPLAEVRGNLLDLLADIEAGLDFVDEDIEFISPAAVIARLRQAKAATQSLAEQALTRSDAASLPRVVLRGQPNAGKSSLLNALAGESVALVSPVAGTTRDYVERRAQIAGVDCLLVDTAGVDEQDPIPPPHGIDQAAAQHSARQEEQATLVLRCIDSSAPPRTLSRGESSAIVELIVATKADAPAHPGAHCQLSARDAIFVSAHGGQGLDELKRRMATAILECHAERTMVVPATAIRCRDSLQAAQIALQSALDAATAKLGDELVAGEIRLALEELGRVAGTVGVDDLLDRVFSRFCIGK